MNTSSKYQLATNNSGFTLVELMVTIAIFATLAMLAIPSFNQIIASTRLTTATNDLYGSLVQAKSEAIRRGTRVTLCPSTDGSSCQTTTPTWTVGWITFVDGTRTTAPTVDAGETVLQVTQYTSPSVVFKTATDYASFSSDGSSRQIDGGFLNSTIRLCNPSKALSNDARARDISILRTGRVTITKPPGIDMTCPAP